jgi:hypothetical protein
MFYGEAFKLYFPRKIPGVEAAFTVDSLRMSIKIF